MTSKYSNGKIYKIVDNTTDMFYVGSTIQNLSDRLKGHETSYEYFLIGKTNYTT